jgi:hypothetical protein
MVSDAFKEPQGWALQWEGLALEPAGGQVGWTLGSVTLAVAPASKGLAGNGAGPAGFPEPGAWALRWHGEALADPCREIA